MFGKLKSWWSGLHSDQKVSYASLITAAVSMMCALLGTLPRYLLPEVSEGITGWFRMVSWMFTAGCTVLFIVTLVMGLAHLSFPGDRDTYR